MKKTVLIIVTSLIVIGIGLGINHQFNTETMKKMKATLGKQNCKNVSRQQGPEKNQF